MDDRIAQHDKGERDGIEGGAIPDEICRQKFEEKCELNDSPETEAGHRKIFDRNPVVTMTIRDSGLLL
jgi:hypothetical protein